MSLTIGTAPFGRTPAGTFNARIEGPAHILYFEATPRRVRAIVDGVTVADSTHASLMHETGLLPVYYFPREDVRTDLLVPSDHRTHCPFKGEATHWTLVVDGRRIEDAAWEYPEPIEGAPAIAGHLAFYWRKLDHWLEEDEEVFGHARDPYHRIDVVPSSRHVVVRLDGEVLAESTRALALFESGLPTRWYLPREDVRASVVPSDTRTRCTYKGIASYLSVEGAGEAGEDLIWSYPDPERAVADIAGRVAFFNERVDLEVDGEAERRPVTQWSAGAASTGPPRP